MQSADLYIDKIALAPYLTPDECRAAGAASREELASRLLSGALKTDNLAGMDPQKRYALSLALRAADVMPAVEMTTTPRPVPPELVEINEPGVDAPVLVTGNSEFTLAVMTGVLATTTAPFYLVLADCRGDTVDMAMVYRSFPAERLAASLADMGLASRVSRRRLIVPGYVAYLKEDLGRTTGWEIAVGPVCAAELPLYLWESWRIP
jgi:CO dehydrogenase/acetyl-CoA synthase gamma subunit (corrinoid Fe-S protein)